MQHSALVAVGGEDGQRRAGSYSERGRPAGPSPAGRLVSSWASRARGTTSCGAERAGAGAGAASWGRRGWLASAARA